MTEKRSENNVIYLRDRRNKVKHKKVIDFLRKIIFFFLPDKKNPKKNKIKYKKSVND